MSIKKFDNFLNEDIQVQVLDVVIDDNGNVYNGMTKDDLGNPLPLTKGNLERVRNARRIEVVGIVSNSGKNFTAGIDKGGNLVAPNNKIDDEGYLLNSRGERMKIPKSTLMIGKFPSKFWKKFVLNGQVKVNLDYTFLIPILPTGWVNVKIDMEVVKRVRRYSKNLGTNTKGFKSFMDKISDLQRMSGGVKLRSRSRETIQKELSVIILLHYINEIKDFFSPGSSGSLFESFIAGLIPNAQVKDDNSAVDVVAEGKSYQLKLYDSLTENVPINASDNLDYLLIGLKYPNKIVLFVLGGEECDWRDFTRTTDSGSRVNVRTITNSGDVPRFTFEISNIEEKIKNIAKGLKESLDDLYSELSQFQYNVESIVSGVDKEGKVLNDTAFAAAERESQINIENMRKQLDSLVKTIDHRNRR